MKVPLVQLQRLVFRAGLLVELLAAARLRYLVGGAVQDEERQGELPEALLQQLVRAHHLDDRLARLRLVGDQRVGVQRRHDRRVARKVFVLELEHVRVRRHVADPLEDRQRDVRRWHLVREVLTDEARDLALVFQRVAAGDYATGTVTEEEHRQARLVRLDYVDERREITRPIRELLDEEALALGVAVAAMIQRVDGEPLGNKLLGYPFVLAAVRVEYMGDDNHGVRLARRLPLAREDLDAVDAFEASFSHVPTLLIQSGL